MQRDWKMKKDKPKEILWAPWRMEYILSAKEEKEKGCIFCTRYPKDDDRNNLILYRGKTAFVIMNRFPYNNGHVMIVPYRHSGDIHELSADEKLEMMDITQLCLTVLSEVMQPHGFNIGMNIGRVSGAGVLDHLHSHVVPRWNGDTNFMPVIGGTKVISEALDKSYDKLKIVFDRKKAEQG
jgi:ATP adenylyltransferase